MFKSLKKAFALLHVLYCLIKTTEHVVNYFEFLSLLFYLVYDIAISFPNIIKLIFSTNLQSNIFENSPAV